MPVQKVIIYITVFYRLFCSFHGGPGMQEDTRLSAGAAAATDEERLGT